MGTKTEEFFGGLAERMWKENDLSDLTYALCIGNMEFRQYFLDFFFKEENLCASDVDISREWMDKDRNRPDFCIRASNGKHLFVEVKLWDGNLHFESYKNGLKEINAKEDLYPAKCLAYIAAYEIDRKDVPGCDSVHTWYEFYDGLRRLSFLNDDTIRGYCAFVFAVAGLQGRVQMDADVKNYVAFQNGEFTKVREFMERLDEAIKSAEGVDAYNGSSRYFKPGFRMGRFFEVKGFKDNESAWGWIGAYYNASVPYSDKSDGRECDGPEICVWFEDRPGWGKPVCEKFKDDETVGKPGGDIWYYKAEGGHLYFYMTDSDRDIASFFNRVLDRIRSGGTESHRLENAKVKERHAALLSMRRFPAFIERRILDVQSAGYAITGIDAGGDSEDPYNHCGRYFTVESRSEKKDGGHENPRQAKGWVGVLFGKNDNVADNATDDKKRDYPRIELQFLKGNGRYKRVREITGDERHSSESIAKEFKEALKEYCDKEFNSPKESGK